MSQPSQQPASFRLYKKEKLCSATAIDTLFAARRAPARGHGGAAVVTPAEASANTAAPVVGAAMAYPWRAVWRVNPKRRLACAQFLISVPKKRLRHAVDRVAMRRRCREAYRLNRHLLPADSRLEIAFIYVGDSLTDYHRTDRAMRKLLARMTEFLAANPLPSAE